MSHTYYDTIYNTIYNYNVLTQFYTFFIFVTWTKIIGAHDPYYYSPSQYVDLNMMSVDMYNMNLMPSSAYTSYYNSSGNHQATSSSSGSATPAANSTTSNNKYKSSRQQHRVGTDLAAATTTTTTTTPSHTLPSTPTTTTSSLTLINDNNNKYNPASFVYTGELEGKRTSRFFVIKSYSTEDVIHSINHGIWCSTQIGNARLDEAFAECQPSSSETVPASVYLFFSVNSSGQFCGMAEMMSRVDYDSSSKLWSQDKWRGTFQVKWIYVKDVPNGRLKHISMPNNENKPVTNSRDTQEVLFDQAIGVLNVFRNYENRTTILDPPAPAVPDYAANFNSNFEQHGSSMNGPHPPPPLPLPLSSSARQLLPLPRAYTYKELRNSHWRVPPVTNAPLPGEHVVRSSSGGIDNPSTTTTTTTTTPFARRMAPTTPVAKKFSFRNNKKLSNTAPAIATATASADSSISSSTAAIGETSTNSTSSRSNTISSRTQTESKPKATSNETTTTTAVAAAAEPAQEVAAADDSGAQIASSSGSASGQSEVSA